MTSQAPSSHEANPVRIKAQICTTGTEGDYWCLIADVNSNDATAQFPVSVRSNICLVPRHTFSGVDSTRIPFFLHTEVYNETASRNIAASDTELVSINASAPDVGPLHDGQWHDVELFFATDRDEEL